MKEAGVHCKLSVYPGAGYLCLYTCKILQNIEYRVNLVSDVFDPAKRGATLRNGKGTIQVQTHSLARAQNQVATQAIGSGAGVAGEVVRAAEVGYTYRTMEETVEKLKIALDGESLWTPYEISERARQLGPRGFQEDSKEACWGEH